MCHCVVVVLAMACSALGSDAGLSNFVILCRPASTAQVMKVYMRIIPGLVCKY